MCYIISLFVCNNESHLCMVSTDNLQAIALLTISVVLLLPVTKVLCRLNTYHVH